MMLAMTRSDWFPKRHAAASVTGTCVAVVLALAGSFLLGGNLLEPSSPFVAIPAILIAPFFLAVPMFFLLLPASYAIYHSLKRCRLESNAVCCSLGGVFAVVFTAGILMLLAYLLSAPWGDPLQAGGFDGEMDWRSELVFHVVWIVSGALGGYAFSAAATKGGVH